MGLLTIIRKQKARERSLRILILGLDNAGKTTILTRLLNGDISKISPTLGFNIRSLQWGTFRLDLWDVGGQKTIRGYWRNYFESTDALVYVVDSTDRSRMGECRETLHSLLQEERLLGADLLVLANKVDVAGCMGYLEIKDALDLDSIIGHRWHIFDVSAVSGRNVEHAFTVLVDDLKKTKFRVIDL